MIWLYRHLAVRLFRAKIREIRRKFSGISGEFKSLPIRRDHFHSDHVAQLEQIVNSMYLIPEFITETEEKSLLNEAETIFEKRRIRYEQSHWDDAIHNYRETEHLNWKPENQNVIERVRQTAFTDNARHIKFVHILDITRDGYIKPHVDSVRFCGDTIAGISLMSDSVMRLRLEQDRTIFVDVLLSRRSLYIMTGDARYLYAHEVLRQEESIFNGTPVKRDRRISIICRNEPNEDEDSS